MNDAAADSSVSTPSMHRRSTIGEVILQVAVLHINRAADDGHAMVAQSTHVVSVVTTFHPAYLAMQTAAILA
jgi:hypothetical protein